MFKKNKLLISAVFFVLACNNSNEGNSTEKPLIYSANELMQSFEKNAEKTHRKLFLKAVQVNGQLLEVDAGSLGATIFVLKTKSKDRATVRCIMLNDDKRYEPGNEVTIKGFYQENDFHVTLDKCVTVEE